MKKSLIATTAIFFGIVSANAQTPSVVRNPVEPPASFVRSPEASPAPAGATSGPMSPSAPAVPHDGPLLSTVKACTPLVSPQGVTRSFNASVNVAAHLIFPLPVASAHVSTTVWTEDHHGNSLWIRPTQASHIADTVGLTVTMTDGRQFDYTVKSVAEPTNCYLVVPFPFVSPNASSLTPEQLAQAQKAAQQAQARRNAQIRAAAQAEAKRKADEAAAYQAQFNAMKQQMMAQAEDRIKQFQMAIHTDYKWPNHDLVTAVYDDGETTYIRVAKTGFGTPVLTGTHDGKEVALEYDYDDLTGVYVVSGLYDKVLAILGTNRVLIKRKG
ncbi:TrbG/VirB9 family P-type conjugative transfer protein [Acetobacter persici]|uniref:TrbG/VirB9 family P-type conjugative transfer protein n=1 Tax=Acetobacter persici TaxID=1076596 RepID=UPI001BAE4338|nr:TrbG/VirB9 family P-type conjugative transfer protein [Acetobacter persici]MBS1017105.1 TrbG/VirB9 family P-type conjugative transfer protein [Acetobacter persici]